MDDDSEQTGNIGKSTSVLCVQYLLSHCIKTKHVVRKDELLKVPALKGRISGKNYDRVLEDVSTTLQNVFGLSLSFIDHKQFLIVNNVPVIDVPGIVRSSTESSIYRHLLKPIISILVMLRVPMSEGQMWTLLEKFVTRLNLDMNLMKKIVKEEFVKDQYLLYKPTDDTTAALDPERTSHWFTLGPRALVECDQIAVLHRVSEIYKKPPTAFKCVNAALNK